MDRAAHSLRIVIPAYNEEERIAPTLTDYCETFADRATIVVVANGCRDATSDVVKNLQKRFVNLTLIDIPNAIGKGGAVRVGLATGNEPFVGFVDADGSTSAGEFSRLFAALAGSPVDSVIGSRWLPDSRVEPRQGFLRRLASRGFNTIVRMLFALPLRDTQCGAKLFRREALRTVLGSLEVADFAFDIEVLWLLRRSGYTIAEIATVWADRAAGTKINLMRSSWAMFVSVLRLRVRYTALWNIPFVDYFGRRGVIPVKRQRRMFVLGIPAPPCDPDVVQLLGRLADADVELVYASEQDNAGQSPLALLFWYAFKSRRDFDAVLEIAGDRLWIVPWISVKPSFIIASRDPKHRFTERHRRWYGRSTSIDLARQDAQSAASALLATAYVSAVYPTIFWGETDVRSIEYPDRQTGTPTSHILR
jgi:glycosyltransferase involved in cell wall biosynthesis